jgi:membrane associated rhomboid family serine protease
MSVEGPVSRNRRDDRTRGLVFVIALLLVMWLVEGIDLLGGHLDSNGIRPRDADGLPGIAFAPFLHASFGHLLGNSIPFAILGAAIALSGLVRIALVTGIVALVGGLGTWLTASAGTVTIGASGLVFGFAAYLIVRGAYTRRVMHVVVGLLVLALYGTSLAFSLIPHPGISWQGHLFGAVGGVLAARVLDRGQRLPRGNRMPVTA